MASRSPSLFLPQLRGELWKLFARKRTYIGFGAYLLIELLILLLLQIPHVKGHFQRIIESQGYLAEHYYSGVTLAFFMVDWTVGILAPLFLALVTGDIVAKEVEDGIMRMILSRPAARWRVVFVRYVAALIYTFALFLFIAGSALLLGLAKQGAGGVLFSAQMERLLALYEFGPGLQRYLLMIPALALGFATISSLGFLFSCCNMKPASATILCLSIYFIDMILQAVPQFASIREYFLTPHIFTWINVFREPVPVIKMVQDYAWLFGVNATFFVVGAMIFQGRDLKA